MSIRIIMLGLLLIIFCSLIAGNQAYGQSSERENISYNKTSDRLNILLDVLLNDKHAPELMIDTINDTLLYGQFWPYRFFEIRLRGDEIYIPVLLIPENDSCFGNNEYKRDDKYTYGCLITSGPCYIIPISLLPYLDTLSCIKNNSIRIYKDCCTGANYTGTMQRSNSNDSVYLTLHDDRQIDGGGTVHADIQVDTTNNVVKLTPHTEPCFGGCPEAFLSAFGTVSFAKPNDTFELHINKDRYKIVINGDSIAVHPLKVCRSIIFPPDYKWIPEY